MASHWCRGWDGEWYVGAVPCEQVDPEWDLMLFLEVFAEPAPLRWPDWRKQTPYFVVRVRPD